ncbi:hypothetical protein E3P99_01862 [Wallemia hederae]|uniref:Protein kinase domain-containing protein n=1 Tax=Wallemia hederae TaxID=1540922 RepID=A0A4T0FPT0_9BASI|nr:hypothetical protein E3P99_01862 [Wallemia hederae]
MESKRSNENNYLVANKKFKSTHTHSFHGSSVISEEYNLSDKIGEGTFGVVFKASSKSTRNQVAIKKILIHTAKDGFPTTSIREITFLKLLSHSNVVDLVDMTYGQENSAPMFYMVFPYMDHDLTGLLERPDFSPPSSQIKLYLQQLCQGTAYMHSNGVLHRDMKASNILISNDGSLKIADFGLARICHKLQCNPASGKSRNYTNMVVTRFYRPPELILGEKNSWGDYGPEIDMWGVGCIFAEMFTHKPILQGQTDIDQLKRIFELCGDPTPTSWPGWETIKGHYDIEISTSGYKGGNLRTRFAQFPNCDQSAFDLLEKMLTLDPKRRITARDALSHDYFWTKPLPMNKKDVKPLPSSHEYDARKNQHQNDKPRAMPPVLPHLQPNARNNAYAPPLQQPTNPFSARPAPAYRPPPQSNPANSMFSGRPPPIPGFRPAPTYQARPRRPFNDGPPQQRPPSNPYVQTAPTQPRSFNRGPDNRDINNRDFSNRDYSSRDTQSRDYHSRMPPSPPRRRKEVDDDVMDYGEPDPPPERAADKSQRSPKRDFDTSRGRDRVDNERNGEGASSAPRPSLPLPPKPRDLSKEEAASSSRTEDAGNNSRSDNQLPPEPKAPYPAPSDVPPPPPSVLQSSSIAKAEEGKQDRHGGSRNGYGNANGDEPEIGSWDSPADPRQSRQDMSTEGQASPAWDDESYGNQPTAPPSLSIKGRARDGKDDEAHHERNKAAAYGRSGRDYDTSSRPGAGSDLPPLKDRLGDRPSNHSNRQYNQYGEQPNRRQWGGNNDNRNDRRQYDRQSNYFGDRRMHRRDSYDRRQNDSRSSGSYDRRDDQRSSANHRDGMDGRGRWDHSYYDRKGDRPLPPRHNRRNDGEIHLGRIDTPPSVSSSSNTAPMLTNKYEARRAEGERKEAEQVERELGQQRQ